MFLGFIDLRKYFMWIISLFSYTNYNNSRKMNYFMKISWSPYFIVGILWKIGFGRKRVLVICLWINPLWTHLKVFLTTYFDHLASKLEDHHMHYDLKTMNELILFKMMFLNEKLECMWFWIFKTCKTQVDGFDLGFDHWISPSNNMHVVFGWNPTTIIIKFDMHEHACE